MSRETSNSGAKTSASLASPRAMKTDKDGTTKNEKPETVRLPAAPPGLESNDRPEEAGEVDQTGKGRVVPQGQPKPK